MSESARMWVEISFNIVYLIAVWGIVIAMTLHKDRVAPENRRVADLGRYAFCLLYTSPSPRDRTRSRMPSSA